MKDINNKLHFPDAKKDQGIVVAITCLPSTHSEAMGIIGFKWINKNGRVVEITPEQFDSYCVSKECRESILGSIDEIDKKMEKKGITKWEIHLLNPFGAKSRVHYRLELTD
tara:strand:- start:5327 stop:5659 length:333 start_codon:yes stop_codon:yes gene_type:complete